MDNNHTGRPTMLNSLNMSKTGLALATNLEATELASPSGKLSSSLALDIKDFVIGQRIYVGGTRPGQIAYIGETHFAPGEWVGVVLDDASGKNDGCVAGKRYFQCDPKRGVFSRINRLTSHPVAIRDNSSEKDFDLKSSRAASPCSVRSGIPTKIASTISRKDFKVGDRVIVSSGLGSRPGELKYIGETKFAPGTWCGIQLDEPSGKNDGAVDGEKYFECPDKYGIFVPVAKVSLSPLARKSNLSRMGSQESLTSVGTMNSFATTNTSRLRMNLLKGKRPSTSGGLTTSTPLPKSNKNAFSLQDVLREKQNYIEQLITERELDREDTHSQNILFQKQICDLKETITHLDSKLIQKTNKVEELQNTLDESQFCSAEKITQLEEKLSNFVSGGSNSSHSNEINCKICPKTADERDQLKLQIKKLLNELETIKLTNLNSDKSIESELRDFEIKSAEYEKNILQLKNEKDILANELLNKKEKYQEDISVTNEKYRVAQQEINELNKDKEHIKKEKILLSERLEAKEKEMLNIISEFKSGAQNNESSLNEKDLQMRELQDKICKITDNNKQQVLEKSEHIQKLLTELETMKSNLTVNRQEKTESLKNLQEIKEDLHSVQLEAKNCQLENNKLNEINKKLDVALNNCNKQVETLNIELKNIKTQNEQFVNELKIANDNLTKEYSLNNENKEKFLIDLKKSQEEFKNISQKFEEASAEISKLSELNKNLTTKFDDKLLVFNEKSNLLNEFESKLLETNLEKNQLETKLKELIENSKKSSTELEAILNEKITEVENLKKNSRDSEARINDLNQKLSEKNVDLDNSSTKIKEYMNSIEEKEKNINLTNEKLQEIEKNCKNASDKITELEELLLAKNKDVENLNKNIEKNAEKLELSEDKEKNMVNIIQNQTDQLNSIFQTISKLEIEVSQLNEEKSLLQQKVDNQGSKLKELREENQNLNTKLINDNENLTISAKNEIQKLTDLLSDRQQNLEQLEIKLNELNIEFNRLDNALRQEKLKNEEKANSILSLKSDLETAKRLSVDIQSKTESKINELKNEKLSLVDDLDKFQKQFNIKEIEISEVRSVINSQNLEIIELNKIILSEKNNSKKLKEENSSKLSEYEVVINNLKTAVEKLDKEKAELLDSEKNVKDSLNLEQKHFYEEIEKKNTELQQFELVLSEKSKINEEICNKNNELLALVESNSIEIKMLSAQNEKKLEEYEKLSLTNEEILHLNEKLKADLDLLSSETDKVKINLNSEMTMFSLAEKEIEVMKIDMDSLKKSNNLLLEEKTNLLNINEKLKNETAELQFKYTEEIKSLTEQIYLKTKELNEISENLNTIKIEKLKLETVYSEKNAESTEKSAAFEEIRNKFTAEISEKTKEIEQIKSNLTVVIEQNMGMYSKLSDERDTLTLELEKRENELRMKNDEMMTQSRTHEKKLETLNLKIQELTISLNDQMKKSNEVLIENSKSVVESSENLQKLQEEIIKLELANNILIKSEADLKDELLACQHERQDALNNIELFGVEYDNEIETVKENNIKLQTDLEFLQAICNQKEKDIVESKNMYEQINILLKEKNSAIAKLQIELNDSKRYNDDQIKQNSVPIPILPINVGGSGGDGSCGENQVCFLNSIIADMFKKNEDLKTRIDLLETNPIDFANSSTLAEYTAALTTVKRKPAPRAFCDICDEFDKHNTEDCPLQESDEIQDFPASNGDKLKTKPEPRKYCESCEMFGHDTGECADDESF